MLGSSILTLGALVAISAALPHAAVDYVLHEKRNAPSPSRTERVESDAIIPIRIALKQSNLHLGDSKLMEVSHPDSPNYGKHMTAEEVHAFFAPAEETVATVKNWLLSSGVEEADIKHYKNKGWLAIDMPAGRVESLLKASYYEHETAKGTVVGCDEYHLPAHVAPHIDFIKPAVMLSSPMKKTKRHAKRGFGGGPIGGGHGHRPGWPGPPHAGPPPSRTSGYPLPPSATLLPPALQTCGVNITPVCIDALYHLPRNKYSDPANRQGLYETYDAFSQQDIDLFFKNYAPWVPQGTSPQVLSVDGGTAPVAAGDPRNGGESDIDIDLSYAIIYPQQVTVYQVDDLPNASGETNTTGFLNTFLDSIDGSYCGYSAYGITGDSPGIDAQYPDLNFTDGYKGQLECGTYSLTRVLSVSYGEAEVYLPKPYVERQCNEFMKLGLQGHSIFFASGDYGVASFPVDNGEVNGCLSGFGQNNTIYNPDYPVGCPYITSVGQTRLYPNQTVYDRESAGSVNLTAFNLQTGVGPITPPYDFFGSGGGFSNYFPVASYQKAAVSTYLNEYNNQSLPYYIVNADATNIGENGGVYNKAGRGYPDVSANGNFLLIYNNLTLNTFFGTSLASPIFASVITLINEERTAAGKGPVGFVNPTLYAHPEVLNDIVNGSNPNCGGPGFKTAPGWDPVTGLGTPNYPKMLELFMSLP